jgi:hypothetical protein
VGWAGGRGLVAASKAYRRRILGVCLAHKSALVTLGPRTCSVPQALAAWGRTPPALPRVLEKPGRTKDEPPRRWHGPSVMRWGEVEYSDGRVTAEARRFGVVHARQLAPQPAQPYASAQGKAAEALAAHAQRVQAPWWACLPDAAALAAYEGRELGRRGRRPRPWRYHTVRSRLVADRRRPRRARRGRRAKTEPPPTEAGYRLRVEGDGRRHAEEDKGWTGLASPVSGEVCTDAEILQAYQEQHTTGAPGLRGSKNPAAIAPVGREKPERLAACAMLTVRGLLVYSVRQRQGRLYLLTHDQQLPGNKGLTATPTAAVVLALCAHGALVQGWIDEQEVTPIAGLQPYHRLVCDALGLDSSWDAGPSAHKNGRDIQTP